MADIKISELTAVSSLNNGDLVEVSQVNELAPSGYTSLKASMADLGKKVNTDIEYTTDLADFTDKTTLGAIKETAKGKNIADEYDDTQTYDKGDVVIYKNTLYICNANNTTGAWDATKWTATTVQSLIGDLSSLTTTNQDSLVDAVNEVHEITNGTIASGDIGANISFSRYKLWKCNGVAHINANIAVSATIAGTSKICDLPSGFGAGTGVVYDFTTIDTLGNTIRGYLNGDRISFNFVGNVQSGAGVIFQITWKVA